MAQREKKGYARKVELGLVPHRYEFGSKAFKAGAHKHWRGDRSDQKLVEMDRQMLVQARAAR
jgi:hypothetical protein